MLLDLHAHSRVSDGTESPEELVAAARAAGIDVLALTDHDTTAGWSAAAAALPRGLRLVPGMEVSANADGISVHLLAYLPDPADEGLLAATERVRDDRLPRLRRMVAAMAADGVPVSWESVEAVAHGEATLGRPHLADALVAAGVVRDRDEAFADLLASRGPYYVRHWSIPALEAVRLIRAAGGVPVIAHPRASRRGRTVSDDVLAALVESGLAGFEVDHRDNPAAERDHLRGLACDLGVLVTGSSDYHGAGKPNRLGENSTAPEVLAAIEEQARSGVGILS